MQPQPSLLVGMGLNSVMRARADCRNRLLTVTTTLRQQGRDVWEFLEKV